MVTGTTCRVLRGRIEQVPEVKYRVGWPQRLGPRDASDEYKDDGGKPVPAKRRLEEQHEQEAANATFEAEGGLVLTSAADCRRLSCPILTVFRISLSLEI